MYFGNRLEVRVADGKNYKSLLMGTRNLATSIGHCEEFVENGLT